MFVGHELYGILFSTCTIYRVWKVIFGIRENAKYFKGKQDLTATREAGFTNIWTEDAGFLAFLREFGKSSRTKMYFLVGKADQPGEHLVVSPSQANKRVTWNRLQLDKH